MPLLAGADNDYETDGAIDEVEDKFLHYFLKIYLRVVRSEYAYYAHSHDDGSYFPPEREAKILMNIRNQYLKRSHKLALFGSDARPQEVNLLYYVASVPTAQLLLRYGADPFDSVERISANGPRTSSLNIFYNVDTSFPLIGATMQTHRLLPRFKKINNQKEHNKRLIYDSESRDKNYAWGTDLPSNNAIALAKLYLALGVDIHASTTVDVFDKEEKFDAVKASLFHIYDDIGSDYKTVGNQHRADDLMADSKNLRDNVHFYRSPVTYWLEEFIDKGYPASMLDTHKLHYPRFMKEARVAEVMDMLNNSDAHKIPANINCPYKDTCPLVPSVNMRDAMGRTPLHIAGEQGNQAVFNALINIGADESIKDYRGNLASY